jgi:phenylacetate-CoA ligase
VLIPRSAVEGVRFPAVPDVAVATQLALQYQLDESEWWPPEQLSEHQLRQLGHLLRHAAAQVPFHRARLAEARIDADRPLTPERWARIPLLTRRDLQESFEDLLARRYPREHGKAYDILTTGSTAMPVKGISTDLCQGFLRAFNLRDHRWHRRDFTKKLAAIRVVKGGGAPYPSGVSTGTWGFSPGLANDTGPSVRLDFTTTTEQQVEWLCRQDPDYLLTLPSMLQAQAAYCIEHRIRLPKLREVLSLAEPLFPEVRALCREAFGVAVKDAYSAQEIGHIASQCPESENLHVHSEGVLIEVLGEDGTPCSPGEVGRVVATPLHNFAMPLIRYELGDLAEVGPPCPCGRGLPVLTRVIGRTRDALRLPDGRTVVPFFAGIWSDFEAIRQFQIVRTALDEVEIKLVAARPLGPSEAERLGARVCERLQYPFRTRVTYHDGIPRAAGGKFLYFRSDVDEPGEAG